MGNGYLFEPVDPNSRTYSPEMHLAQMIAVLGPPPREFLARGTRTSTYFDVNGKYSLVFRTQTSLFYIRRSPG